MVNNRSRIFPSIPDSIQVTVFFWLWMFGLIAAGNASGLENQFGAINPAILYTTGFLALSALALRNADSFDQLKQSLGLKTGVQGFGVLSIIAGLGFGIILYTVFSKPILSIAGSASITSIAQPFYNPYTASATAYSLGGVLEEAAGALFLNAFVAIFEEAYKIVILKNIANYLYVRRKLDATIALGIALFGAFVLWGVWHFFSWDGLTLASIFMSIMYGVFFYVSYAALSITNILPVGRIESNEFDQLLSGIVIYPAVGSHFAWNVLISLEGFGVSTTTLLTVGISAAIIPILIMLPARSTGLAKTIRNIT